MRATWQWGSLVLSLSVVTASCAGTTSVTRSSMRTLPTHISADAVRLLAGCTVVTETFDLELSCPDDVIVATQSQPTALEQTFLVVASEAAISRGVEVAWTDTLLATDLETVRVREARFVTPGGESAGFVLGVSRPKGSLREDLWCAAPSMDHREWCVALVTALLQPALVEPPTAPSRGSTHEPLSPAPTSPSAVATGDESTASAAPSLSASSPVTPAQPAVSTPRLGRWDIALPSSCRIVQQDLSAGSYQCPGVALTWRAVIDQEAAEFEAETLLNSFTLDEKPQDLPCRHGRAAWCRGHSFVVVSVATIDGVAVLSRCVVTETGLDARRLDACRALLAGEW